MKLIGQLHRFNTGRRYGAEGQRIAWAILEAEGGKRFVVFADRDRQIEGCIPLFFGNLDLVTDDWVLRAYDDHHWTYQGAAFQVLRHLMEATV